MVIMADFAVCRLSPTLPPASYHLVATRTGLADVTSLDMHVLLLPQLPAPLSTQGLPTCHPFSTAAICRVPESLLISTTCVPGHLPSLPVPDPRIQSPPRSHSPPVPQALNTKPVPGLLPQWVIPSAPLPRCHLGQFYLTKAYRGLTGPSLQPQPHCLPLFHQPPVLSQAWDNPPTNGAEARSMPAMMAPGDTA